MIDKLQAQAEREGYEAGRRGLPAEACPYSPRSQAFQFRAWQLGRVAGLVEVWSGEEVA